MTKEKALEAVNALPAEFEVKELVERLLFMERVEKGIQQIKEGNVKPHAEVKEMIQSWLQQ